MPRPGGGRGMEFETVLRRGWKIHFRHRGGVLRGGRGDGEGLGHALGGAQEVLSGFKRGNADPAAAIRREFRSVGSLRGLRAWGAGDVHSLERKADSLVAPGAPGAAIFSARVAGGS